jgi:hypothetical protein
MKGKKLLLLFLALLLPSCIFIFLKFFGKNEFEVLPLFTEQLPPIKQDCNYNYTLPYHIADTSLHQITDGNDSLICVVFQKQEGGPLARIQEKYESEPVAWRFLDPEKNSRQMRCIFVLTEPFNTALVDSKGRIRGHYNSADRDEMDRLLIEISVLLKKY